MNTTRTTTTRTAAVRRGGANYWTVHRKVHVQGTGWVDQPVIVTTTREAAREVAREWKECRP